MAISSDAPSSNTSNRTRQNADTQKLAGAVEQGFTAIRAASEKLMQAQLDATSQALNAMNRRSRCAASTMP